MVKRNKKPRSKKKLITTLVVIVIIGGLVAGFLWWRSHPQSHQKYQKTSTGYDVNLNPPTEEEKKETDQNKDRVSQEQQKEDTKSPAARPGGASPFITFAGQEGQTIEIAGYVTGVFEDGGTCTATVTKGAQTVTATSQGFKDSNHTTCTPIDIARSKFSASGTWSVTLSYSSTAGSGVSEPRNVTIQ